MTWVVAWVRYLKVDQSEETMRFGQTDPVRLTDCLRMR